MLLYVIRHAEAVDPAECATDEERPLTKKGHAQAKRLAAMLHQQDVRLSVVLSSPLVRAWETAEGVIAGLKPKPSLVECAVLAPGGDSSELAAWLERQPGDTALVGHNPDLEQHIAWLIGSRKAQVAMAKAAVACLDCDRPFGKGCATLRWLVTPDFC